MIPTSFDFKLLQYFSVTESWANLGLQSRRVFWIKGSPREIFEQTYNFAMTKIMIWLVYQQKNELGFNHFVYVILTLYFKVLVLFPAIVCPCKSKLAFSDDLFSSSSLESSKRRLPFPITQGDTLNDSRILWVHAIFHNLVEFSFLRFSIVNVLCLDGI